MRTLPRFGLRESRLFGSGYSCFYQGFFEISLLFYLKIKTFYRLSLRINFLEVQHALIGPLGLVFVL